MNDRILPLTRKQLNLEASLETSREVTKP